jgi:hypothetical protein
MCFLQGGFKITTSSQIRWNRKDDRVLASDVKLTYTINCGSGKVSKGKRRKKTPWKWRTAGRNINPSDDLFLTLRLVWPIPLKLNFPFQGSLLIPIGCYYVTCTPCMQFEVNYLQRNAQFQHIVRVSRTIGTGMYFVWHCSLLMLSTPTSVRGARRGALGWGTALQAGRSRIRFPMSSLEFFIDILLPVALWPWVRLSLW